MKETAVGLALFSFFLFLSLPMGNHWRWVCEKKCFFPPFVPHRWSWIDGASIRGGVAALTDKPGIAHGRAGETRHSVERLPWRQCVVLVVSSNGTAPAQRRATRPDSFASRLGPCCRRRRAQKNARTERNETVGPRDKISRRGRPAAPKSALLNLQKKRDKKGGGPRRPKATRGGGAVSSAPLLFFFLSAFCRGKSGRVLFSRLYLFFFLEFFCLRAVSGYGARERRARAGTAQAATRKQ